MQNSDRTPCPQWSRPQDRNISNLDLAEPNRIKDLIYAVTCGLLTFLCGKCHNDALLPFDITKLRRRQVSCVSTLCLLLATGNITLHHVLPVLHKCHSWIESSPKHVPRLNGSGVGTEWSGTKTWTCSNTTVMLNYISCYSVCPVKPVCFESFVKHQITSFAAKLLLLMTFVTSIQLHPDLNPSDPSNHIKFVRLNEAYSILSNNTSRREYDFGLQHWNRVHATASTSPQPPSYHRLTNNIIVCCHSSQCLH